MRRTLLLVVPFLVLPACSQAHDAVDTAGRVRDCTGLARDVLSAGITRVPTQAQAEAAQKKLQDRVDGIKDEKVKDAASSLADKVGELTTALRGADRATVSAKVREVRAAAADAAQTCDLPVGAFGA